MFRALLLLALVSCGTAPNRLYGSLSEVYELQFDKVVVNRIDQYLVIEYQKANGAKTMKISIYVADLTITADSSIDLAGTVGTMPRATVQRIVDATIDVGVEQGSITFNAAPEAGKTISGKFLTKTQTPAGRTLNGDFQGTVTQL